MLSIAISDLASKGPAWNEGSLHTVRDIIYTVVTWGVKCNGQNSGEECQWKWRFWVCAQVGLYCELSIKKFWE